MKKHLSALPFFIFTLFITGYCVINPQSIALHCKNALSLCARTAIPSLFMFTVLSNLISEITSRISFSKNAETRFMRKKAVIEAPLLPICLFGIFSGAVPACTAISEKVCKKDISKASAENALLLLSGCSIPFILTVCGAELYSIRLTALLVLSNFLASLTSFFILCSKSEISTQHVCADSKKIRPFSHILPSALSISLHSTLNMCTYIIFFYVISGITSDIFSILSIKNDVIKAIISGILEMTSGIAHSSAFSGNEKTVFIAFTVAFSGISMIFQLDSICSQAGISIKKYICSRLLCSVLCPLYILLFLYILPREITCFAQVSEDFLKSRFSDTDLLTAVFLTCVILFTFAVFIYIDKKHKKNVQK